MSFKIIIVIGIICFADLIITVRNYFKNKEMVSDEVYKCGYEGIMKNICLFVICYSILSLSDLIRKGDFLKENTSEVYIELLFLIVINLYSIFKATRRVKIYKEGILFTNNSLVMWEDIKRIEYVVTPMEKYYVISVFGNRKSLDKLKVKINKIGGLLEIIKENSSADIKLINV